jgi:hypothetical protein
LGPAEHMGGGRLPKEKAVVPGSAASPSKKRKACNHEPLVSPEIDAKVPLAELFLSSFADVRR